MYVVLWEKVKWLRESKAQKSQKKVPYIMIHFPGFFSFVLVNIEPPGSTLVCHNAWTRFMNRHLTFCPVLAEVSMYSHPNCHAIAAPSSFDTSCLKVLSHLLPMSRNIGCPRLIWRMDWRKTSSQSNVNREVTEYTRMNPCPSLITHKLG